MSERLENQSSLTRQEVFNLGVACTQLGITNTEELSSTLILGSRIWWRRGEALRAVETLRRIIQ